MTSQAATADGLAARLTESILATMDVLTVYIGDRLGYYRALAGDRTVTAAELAERTGTTERYTREWLEQQAITGIVAVDDVTAPPDERRYALPGGHAEVLTDEDSLSYLAPFARMVAAAGVKAPDIVAAHRNGGGVSWRQFGIDMRRAQGDMNRPFFTSLIGSEWFPAVPELDDTMRRGARVADVGCGLGWSAIAMAEHYPGVRVEGFDIDEPSIAEASANADARDVADRVTFHHADAAADLDGRFDVVTAFECIHDVPDPVGVLATMRRLAGDDGFVLVMDEKVAPEFGAIGDDVERIMYGFSNLICLPDSMSHPRTAATGTVMRPDTLAAYAADAGFGAVAELPITADLWRFYRLD